MLMPTFMPNSAPMLMKIRLGSKLNVSLPRPMRPIFHAGNNWPGIQAAPSRSPAINIPSKPAMPMALAFFIPSPPCAYIALRVSPVGMFAGKRSASTWIICRLSGMAMNKPSSRITAMNKVSCHQINS